MPFDGLPAVRSKVDGVTESLKRLEREAQTSEAALAKLNQQLATAGAHAEHGSPGLAPGEQFTPEQLNLGGPRVNPASGGVQMAAQLQDLIDRVTKLMGPDNYVAQFLEKEIPYLKTGARSAAEATSLIQNVLLSYFAGFQKELADPNTPPEVRKLIEELKQLALSGHLTMDKIKQAADRIEQGVKTVGDTVHAGIGGDSRALAQQLERTSLALGGSHS